MEPRIKRGETEPSCGDRTKQRKTARAGRVGTLGSLGLLPDEGRTKDARTRTQEAAKSPAKSRVYNADAPLGEWSFRMRAEMGGGGRGGGLTCWGWSILLYRARAAEQQPLALRRQRASRQSGKNDRPSESMPA